MSQAVRSTSYRKVNKQKKISPSSLLPISIKPRRGKKKEGGKEIQKQGALAIGYGYNLGGGGLAMSTWKIISTWQILNFSDEWMERGRLCTSLNPSGEKLYKLVFDHILILWKSQGVTIVKANTWWTNFTWCSHVHPAYLH